MRHQGRIVDWKDDKGFGFVTPSDGGDRAFVHISTFVNRGRRPINGDVVSYELGVDERKRPRALQLRFSDEPTLTVRAKPAYQGPSRRSATSHSRGGVVVLGLLLLAIAGVLGYKSYHGSLLDLAPRPPSDNGAYEPTSLMGEAGQVAPSSSFKCDGRAHCSQMRSCEEATYFIRHCPNTEMDGDGDGRPCESQLCDR